MDPMFYTWTAMFDKIPILFHFLSLKNTVIYSKSQIFLRTRHAKKADFFSHFLLWLFTLLYLACMHQLYMFVYVYAASLNGMPDEDVMEDT